MAFHQINMESPLQRVEFPWPKNVWAERVRKNGIFQNFPKHFLKGVGDSKHLSNHLANSYVFASVSWNTLTLTPGEAPPEIGSDEKVSWDLLKQPDEKEWEASCQRMSKDQDILSVSLIWLIINPATNQSLPANSGHTLVGSGNGRLLA